MTNFCSLQRRQNAIKSDRKTAHARERARAFERARLADTHQHQCKTHMVPRGPVRTCVRHIWASVRVVVCSVHGLFQCRPSTRTVCTICSVVSDFQHADCTRSKIPQPMQRERIGPPKQRTACSQWACTTGCTVTLPVDVFF